MEVVEVEVVGMMVVAAAVTGEAVARRGLLLVGETELLSAKTALILTSKEGLVRVAGWGDGLQGRSF